MIGIYKIVSPSGKVYIGQSTNIERRWKEYKTGLGRGQIKLKKSFEKYGVENHIFSVLINCDKDQLNTLERYYQEFYNSVKKGLNCLLVDTDIKKRELSDETKIQRSETLKKTLSNPLIRKKMSDERKGSKNHFFGKTHTEEARKKISINSKGKPIS